MKNKIEHEKEITQPTDDGKLYFHTHDLWQVLDDVEKFYECEIYGILALQDTVENLRHYLEFEECAESNPSFICSVDDIPKQLILEAHRYALQKVEYQDYQTLLDVIEEYIVHQLKLVGSNYYVK